MYSEVVVKLRGLCRSRDILIPRFLQICWTYPKVIFYKNYLLFVNLWHSKVTKVTYPQVSVTLDLEVAELQGLKLDGVEGITPKVIFYKKYSGLRL